MSDAAADNDIACGLVGFGGGGCVHVDGGVVGIGGKCGH